MEDKEPKKIGRPKKKMITIDDFTYPKRVYGLIKEPLGYCVCEFKVENNTLTPISIGANNTLLNAANQLAIVSFRDVINCKTSDLYLKPAIIDR